MLGVGQICHPGKFIIRRFFPPMITRIQIDTEILLKVQLGEFTVSELHVVPAPDGAPLLLVRHITGRGPLDSKIQHKITYYTPTLLYTGNPSKNSQINPLRALAK